MPLNIQRGESTSDCVELTFFSMESMILCMESMSLLCVFMELISSPYGIVWNQQWELAAQYVELTFLIDATKAVLAVMVSSFQVMANSAYYFIDSQLIFSINIYSVLVFSIINFSGDLLFLQILLQLYLYIKQVIFPKFVMFSYHGNMS